MYEIQVYEIQEEIFPHNPALGKLHLGSMLI